MKSYSVGLVNEPRKSFSDIDEALEYFNANLEPRLEVYYISDVIRGVLVYVNKEGEVILGDINNVLASSFFGRKE